ncbi:unnamed protein product [Bursaphelenchus okinawaensis]|uniref:Uncharacterized protein n=1 Tax=Bursaphelenchus okinawaensis TaxID=465554 RepID=A0A811L5D8_9BILA|nr:unnamed protein product [Bursaphelenchus okinawaensis]CAG9117930.1 unnamed protein product [Bursaphelenchus okinawaensis]
MQKCDYPTKQLHNYSYDYGVRPTCCCGFHVQTGALIIGVLGMLSCIVAIGFSAFYGMYYQLGFAIGGLLMYLLIILAINFKQPQLFVPFLITNFVGVMLYGIIYIVSVFYLFVELISSLSNEYTTRDAIQGRMVRWITFFQMVAILLCLVIGMWFETVVYRAYRFMKDEMVDMPTTQNMISTHFLKPATFKKSPPGQVV